VRERTGWAEAVRVWLLSCAELGRCGEIGRARGKGGGGGLGHFARAAGLLGGFGSGWGSGFHSLLFFKPLKPI